GHPGRAPQQGRPPAAPSRAAAGRAVPVPAAQAARAAPAAAVTAAEKFTAAWTAGRDTTRWLSRISQYATPRLISRLAVTKPQLLPATHVTGSARVTGQARAAVSLSVPTDAGPVLITVRLLHGRWRADSVMLAWQGN